MDGQLCTLINENGLLAGTRHQRNWVLDVAAASYTRYGIGERHPEVSGCQLDNLCKESQCAGNGLFVDVKRSLRRFWRVGLYRESSRRQWQFNNPEKQLGG
jgi:hypothetical protein